MGSMGKTGLLLAAALALAYGASQHWGLRLPAPELQAPPAKTAAALRKCLPESGAGAVLYSSSACPAGTREQRIAGGTVNVLPSLAAVAAAKPASAQTLMQRLAPPEEAAALREKRMERAIQP
jgi:hypothetical protein